MQKILYVDLDNVLVAFPSAFPHLSLEILQEYEDRLDEVPGIFSLMEPLPQAIASFEELATKFDTYILSTSPWGNPSAWSDKRLWVKRYLGEVAYKRLILSHHKHLNYGHFLIDDRTKTEQTDSRANTFCSAPMSFPIGLLSWIISMEKLCKSRKFRRNKSYC
jgi:hypothetical protein